MRVDERIDKMPQADNPSDNERLKLINTPEFTIHDEEVTTHVELNRTSQTRDQSDIEIDCRYVVHETMNCIASQKRNITTTMLIHHTPQAVLKKKKLHWDRFQKFLKENWKR